MAGEPHTAGELGIGTYRAEATPGVIQTGTRSYLADTIELNNDSDDQGDFVVLPGSRCFGAFQRGPYNKGFTIKYHTRGAGGWGDWTAFLAYYGFGAAAGLADHLATFSFFDYIVSALKYEVYAGCKINKAMISGSQPGRFLDFEANILSQIHTTAPSTRIMTDYQDITFGADPSTPSEDFLTWNANLQINIAGGGLNTFFPKKFSLTVDNHLERIPGIKTWFDATKYPTSVEIHEDIRDIIFECEMALKDSSWDEYKRKATAMTALTIPVGAKTITLSNGYLVPNAYRKLAQKSGADTLKMMFKSLSIA